MFISSGISDQRTESLKWERPCLLWEQRTVLPSNNRNGMWSCYFVRKLEFWNLREMWFTMYTYRQKAHYLLLSLPSLLSLFLPLSSLPPLMLFLCRHPLIHQSLLLWTSSMRGEYLHYPLWILQVHCINVRIDEVVCGAPDYYHQCTVGHL